MREYLETEDFRVVIVANGCEALYAARQEKPDLDLLNIMVPEMSGYDFIRTYRKESETPTILLTAKLDETNKILGLELGGLHHQAVRDEGTDSPHQLRPATCASHSP